MYYKKLINRTKLVKFWIFSGIDNKYIIKTNYQFIYILYNKNCFLDFKSLLLHIKNILPFFLNLKKLNTTILFVSNNFIYSQSIYNFFFLPIIKKLMISNSGIFTNFSVTSIKSFKTLDFYFNPSLIINFYLNKNLLLESKKKNIPLIGLLPMNVNTYLIDYPLPINSIFFYTIYFFSKFFLN